MKNSNFPYKEVVYRLLYHCDRKAGIKRSSLTLRMTKAGYAVEDWEEIMEGLILDGMIERRAPWLPRGGKTTIYQITRKGKKDLDAYTEAVQRQIQAAV